MDKNTRRINQLNDYARSEVLKVINRNGGVWWVCDPGLHSCRESTMVLYRQLESVCPLLVDEIDDPEYAEELMVDGIRDEIVTCFGTISPLGYDFVEDPDFIGYCRSEDDFSDDETVSLEALRRGFVPGDFSPRETKGLEFTRYLVRSGRMS